MTLDKIPSQIKIKTEGGARFFSKDTVIDRGGKIELTGKVRIQLRRLMTEFVKTAPLTKIR